MTIRLPGLMEEIAPAIPQLGDLLKFAVNPNYQQQSALRDAMLRDPSLAQKLADMGPQAVESIYGRGTGKITPNLPESNAHKMEGYKSSALAQVMSGPKNIRDQFLADSVGAMTPQAMEMKAQELIGKKASIEGTIASTDHTKQATEIGKYTLNEAQKNEADQNAADAMATALHARLGYDPMSKDAYNLVRKGVIKGEELNVLLSNPKFKLKYENDRQDNHQREEMDLRRQMHAESIAARKDNARQFSEENLIIRSNVMVAQNTAEKFGGDVRTIMQLRSSPSLVDAQIAKGPPPPGNPDATRIYEAAVAINTARELPQNKEVEVARRQFNATTAKDMAILRNESNRNPISEGQKQAALDRVQKAAVDILGGAGVPIPQYHYDKESKNTPKGPWAWLTSQDKPTFYWKGGDPSVTGTDGRVDSSQGGGQQAQGQAQAPQFNPGTVAAVKDVMEGKSSYGELISKAPPARREEFKQAFAYAQSQLQKQQTQSNAPPTPMAQQPTSIGAPVPQSQPQPQAPSPQKGIKAGKVEPVATYNNLNNRY